MPHAMYDKGKTLPDLAVVAVNDRQYAAAGVCDGSGVGAGPSNKLLCTIFCTCAGSSISAFAAVCKIPHYNSGPK
jgi:hypothetical protein